MSVQVRTITDDDLPAFARQDSYGFGYPSRPEDVERLRKVLDPSRALAAWDGERIVGTAASYPYGLTVPGEASEAAVPSAGVTAVTVLSTHRRQGILTEMMRTQLTDVRARRIGGDPLGVRGRDLRPLRVWPRGLPPGPQG